MYEKVNLRQVKQGDVITTVLPDGSFAQKEVTGVNGKVIFAEGGVYPVFSSYNKKEPFDAIIGFASHE